ncbi:MAG: PolC-type DNA polymerase III [Bacillota bacterium]
MLEALFLDNIQAGFKYCVLDETNKTCYLIKHRDSAQGEAESQGEQDILSDFKEKLNPSPQEYQVIKIGPLSLPDEVKLIWPGIIADLPQKLKYLTSWLQRAKIIWQEETLYVRVESQLACKSANCREALNYLNRQLNSYLDREIDLEIVNGDFIKTCTPDNDDSEITSYLVQDNPVKTSAKREKSGQTQLIYGNKIAKNKKIFPLTNLPEDGQAVVTGKIFSIEDKDTKNGRLIKLISITDDSDSVKIKLFLGSNRDLHGELKEGDRIKVAGDLRYDRYSRETTMAGESIMRLPARSKEDSAAEKRVELHLHTKMSQMDAIIDVKEAVAQAAEWGHPAIAVTDHGVAQAFPDAYQAGQKHDIKIIYGLEGYLVDDCLDLVQNYNNEKLSDQTFVVFDLETTGLRANKEKIIEIGAVKISEGIIVDTYSNLINPEKRISPKITSLTGISNEEVKNAPVFADKAQDFKEFISGSVLVAHNIDFDHSFLKEEFKRIGEELPTQPLIDTVELSRALLPELKSYKLNKVAKALGINLDNHHRAEDDARAAADIFLNFLREFKEKDIHTLKEINSLASEIDWEKKYPYHVIILAQNKKGLKELYRLISESHLDYFYKKPRILKSRLDKVRSDLLIGSACESGKLYEAVLNGKSEAELIDIANFYDYLEIQPLGNNKFLLEKNAAASFNELEDINRKIYQLGRKLNLPVVATTDAHFLNPEDSIYREILQTGQKFSDADQQPPLYFRTTDEMLEEFSYLGKEQAQEVVVDNTNLINSKIEEMEPMPSGLFTPKIENADEEIREMTYSRARALYGEDLPELVVNRLEKELKSIIDNGFAVIYLISHKLVKKSLEDGFLVGSRGSVGSSLVAYMCEITEVNPLPPHYRCPECNHTQFFLEGEIGVGADLADKNCPNCESAVAKDGFDTPFEVFMGFAGNKVPDIDLNFSGEYQAEVHAETERIFGRDYVYRAGTISTIADRTAYGFVKGYLQDKEIHKRNTEINRLVQGCTGVKRTTGQHPGGLMVVPRDMDIHDFTPIQRPANDQTTDVRTTHFDYHAISGRILKLDLLGHDDPTSIRMLQDLTGLDPLTIPLDDSKTMSLFSGVKALNLTENVLDLEVGTLGIPEFGTYFVRQMLTDTRPSTFAELVRISGLSHGTDVWLNNAKDFIESGKAQLKDVISVRDDIMNYLIQKGLDAEDSFMIMEHVRKGKGLTDAEYKKMIAHDVPEWYIESCRRIKYMFPKAHAAAYVMMAFRIAYFKVNYPAEFYTTYFSIKASDFDSEIISKGFDHILNYINELKKKGNDATAKEKGLITVLEIVIEAMERGIEFIPVDLYKSEISTFKHHENKLLPPLVSVNGLGSSAAESLIAARQQGEFSSIEDLCNRTSLSSTVVETMKELGALDGLPARDQLSLFT